MSKSNSSNNNNNPNNNSNNGSGSHNINWNIPDVDDSPPPAYEASAPPFNPSFIEPTSQSPSSSSSNSHPHYIEPTPIHHNNNMTATYNTNHNNNNNNIPNNNPNYNNPHVYNQLYPQIPPILTQQQQQHRPSYHPVQIQMPMPQATSPIRPYQQPNYHTMPMPMPVSANSFTHNRERKGFPLGALFFLFGWFCPPLWVVGACCCASSRNEYEAWWGKVNFVMAMALIISSILFSAFTLSDYF